MENKHYNGCPIKRGYDCCTCDMMGEESCVIEWQIARQEGRERWWHISAKLTLAGFGCGEIKRLQAAGE